MIKDILFQIKYLLSQISFKRKRELDKRLRKSFGKIKNDSFHFEMIEKYFRGKDNSGAYHVISDKTCNDLDFEDLFMFVDRTSSRVGQQYLYHKIRTIKLDEKGAQLDQDIIAELSKNDGLRISIQKKLEKLRHNDAYYISTLFQEEHLNPPRGFFIFKLLSFTSIVSLILTFFNSLFFIVLIVVFCINIVIHYWNKKNLIQYVNSLPQLLRLNNTASYLFMNPLLKNLNPTLSKSIKLINEVKNRMSFFHLEVKLQGEFQIVAWLVFEIFKTLFLLEPLLLFGVLKRLNTKRGEIEDVFKYVGHIDVLISIASLRAGLNTYCIPAISTNDNKIIAEDVRHPLIFNCVCNSIEISKKSILLTGSNMSGKTSFIRSIGLNIITGLTINTCFAKSLTFPLLKVFSAIRISDDLINDKSYYFEEVLTIKEMISESINEEKCLFLLDEIFKGTNTVERISAGKAVLSKLAKNNNIVLVSTHDMELTDLLSNEYDLYHFNETVKDETVGFDYRLKKGKLKNRNAIKILKINNYPEEVVSEAIKISRKLDNFYFGTKS